MGTEDNGTAQLITVQTFGACFLAARAQLLGAKQTRGNQGAALQRRRSAGIAGCFRGVFDSLSLCYKYLEP